MKYSLFSLLLSLVSLFSLNLALAQTADLSSPTGLWTQVDDETNKPRSLIRIEKQNDEYVGFIEKIFPLPNEEPREFCTECEGDKKDKPLIGLQILWGLKERGKKFEGGKILDPKNGTEYRCKMELIDGGKKLKVRGFVGISLLGRSQTWIRAVSAEGTP